MERFPQNVSNSESHNEAVEKLLMEEGIDFVFEQNPELASIGTKEEYEKYLKSVFPDSGFRKIVYHNSDAEFKDEEFKPMDQNFDTLNSLKGIHNFSTSRSFTQRYGRNTYAVLLDIRNPIEESSSGEYADDMDRPLSEVLFKIGKQTASNPLAPAYDERLKDVDGVINHISGEHYVAQHPVSGEEMGLPEQAIVTVFDGGQVHILGSKNDAEGFKKFVDEKVL